MDPVVPTRRTWRVPFVVPAVVSGIILALSFPPFRWWWAAWIALIPFYVSLSSSVSGHKAWARGLVGGAFLGLSVYLAAMFWMNEIGPVPWAVLSLIESTPFALMGLIFVLAVRRVPSAWMRPILFGAVWVVFEWLRSTGKYAFPWFVPSVSQVRVLPLVQMISLTGHWGVSFAIACFAGFLGEAWQARSGLPKALRFALRALVVPACVLVLGALAVQIDFSRPENEAPLRTIAIAQGSVDDNGTRGEDAIRHALDIYLALTRQAAFSGAKPDLIVWPETVIPGTLLTNFSYADVSHVARETNTALLVGSEDINVQNEVFNSAFLFDASGSFRAQYDKMQLVPMGEFFLFRSLLGSIYKQYGVPPYDMASGTRPGVLLSGSDDRKTQIGALICYESAFSARERARVRDGAQVLVMLTSDQTFGTTAGPYQHADFAVLRAIETRRYLVRAASTGTSEFVAPTGRVIRTLPLGARGVLSETVRLRDNKTLFVLAGDWFVWLCATFTVAALGIPKRRGANKKRQPETDSP